MIKVSRSGVELSLNCMRCFVLQYKHRVKPFSLPFTLNSAVDNLAKNEFDYYREKEEPHPLFIENGIDAVPFKHPDMDRWRNFRQGGLFYKNDEKGYHFWGAVDDIWKKPNDELIISDVKATSKNNFDWQDTWNRYEYPKAYRRQLEMYQWLLRKNGFQVSDKAYLVYYNGQKNNPMFNQTLKFDLHLVEMECDDSWVEDAIVNAKNLLENDSMPQGSTSCENCQYLKKRWDVSQSIN